MQITSTTLGREDHGIFTAFLTLEGDSIGVGFGGYVFTDSSGFGIAFIDGVLSALGVSRWEKLPGTYLRAEFDGGRVVRIGHITKDRWFDPKELAERYT